jgi:chaperone BCS1
MSLIKNDLDFQKCINLIKPNSIIVMEDVDSIMSCRKRKEYTEERELKSQFISPELSLSVILNFIDGIEENEFIFIMTTNHPDKLDPALIRPGRFDFSTEIKKCTNETFKEIFEFYCESPFPDGIQIPDYTFSTAFLIDLCFKNRLDTSVIFDTLNVDTEVSR